MADSPTTTAKTDVAQSTRTSPTSWLSACAKFGERVSRTFIPFVIFGALLAVIAGALGDTMGLPKLFRDDPELREYPWSTAWFRNSPVLCGSAGMTILLMIIWDGIDVSERLKRDFRGQESGRPPRSLPERGLFIAKNGALFLLALLVATALPKWKSGYLAVLGDLVEAIVGIAFGAVLASIAAWVVDRWLRPVLAARVGGHWIARGVLEKLRWLAHPSRPQSIDIRVIDDFWVFLSAIFVLWAVATIWGVLVPAVGILLFALLAITIYFFILYVNPAFRVPLFLVYAVALGFSAGDQYRNRFPGLGTDSPVNYYKAPVCLSGCGSSPGDAISPVAALDSWKKSWKPTEPEHTLVIVAVSGGAYRAGFWTAKVLDKLAKELPDLPHSVRLLTGASGGMVASAYFAALAPQERFEEDGRPSRWPSIAEKISCDILGDRSKNAGKFGTIFPLSGDGLGPVAQQMVQRDVVRYLFAPLLWNAESVEMSWYLTRDERRAMDDVLSNDPQNKAALDCIEKAWSQSKNAKVAEGRPL